DLPKPKHPVKVGPPAPPLPTLVFFSRDVVVLRGRPGRLPDELDCDELRLKMVSAPKTDVPRTAEEQAEDPTGAATGAGTEMTLREAHATGHAVWLRSKSQGITARCNELIHKKLAPEQADETYLRGDPTMKLQVEKVETVQDGPDKGKIKSV